MSDKKSAAVGLVTGTLAGLVAAGSVHLYQDDPAAKRKALRAEVVESCKLVQCNEPRANFSKEMQSFLKEACDGQCARRQVLVRGETVEPLLDLTQYWENGKLQCK